MLSFLVHVNFSLRRPSICIIFSVNYRFIHSASTPMLFVFTLWLKMKVCFLFNQRGMSFFLPLYLNRSRTVSFNSFSIRHSHLPCFCLRSISGTKIYSQIIKEKNIVWEKTLHSKQWPRKNNTLSFPRGHTISQANKERRLEDGLL